MSSFLGPCGVQELAQRPDPLCCCPRLGGSCPSLAYSRLVDGGSGLVQGGSGRGLIVYLSLEFRVLRFREKPYKFIRFGTMAVTKPYKFIGFGAMAVTKPYQFIGRDRPGSGGRYFVGLSVLPGGIWGGRGPGVVFQSSGLLSGSLATRYSDSSGFRPIFGQTWPQNPSRTAGVVLQCRLHQKSGPPDKF